MVKPAAIMIATTGVLSTCISFDLIFGPFRDMPETVAGQTTLARYIWRSGQKLSKWAVTGGKYTSAIQTSHSP
jgi:hypothetical protein